MEDKDKQIVLKKLHDLIGEKFGNYSRYIIQDRALPDINDGLKPVQRRILFAMHSLKLFQKSPYKKSARVVGDVIGKYHPHGDSSVYEAMIRMSQEWKMAMPLVDMHGNKGSVDGDSAAAMRYTEARLQEIAQYLIGDIDKKIVKFNPNFDDTELEPSVFPSLYPNLLVNGATGIASGYSTNIPPHNFNEVIDAIIYVLKNPEATIKEISKIIKGPDFPTGGTVEGKREILDAYKKGRGKVIIKSKINYDKNRNALIINEIPYEVNKASLVKKIDDLINSPSVTTIKEVVDETDKTGLQIAILLKAGVNYNSVINFLLKKTDLQKSYSFNMIAIKDKSPQLFSLMEYLNSFSRFTISNHKKLFEYELDKVNVRLEIVEGIIRAIPIIDEIIEIIRKSSSKSEARENIVKKFKFSENQAEAILNLRLYRLSNTDIVAFEAELSELKLLKEHYEKGLKDKNYLVDQVVKNLEEMNKKFVIERRTKVKNTNDSETETFNVKDLIREEEVTFSITKKGFIKVLDEEEFDKKSKVTIDDMLLVEEKIKSFNSVFLLTNHGKYYSTEIFKIPKSKAKDNGINITNLFSLMPDEKIIKVLFAKEEDLKSTNNLIIATKHSLIKKIKYELLSGYTSKSGVKLIKLVGNDLVASYINAYDDEGIVNTITKRGNIIRYPISNISISTLSSQGVQNIKLEGDDEVVGIVFQDGKSISSSSESIIFVTKNAVFRKLALIAIRETSRNGKGQKLVSNLPMKQKLNIIEVFSNHNNNYKTIEFLDESFEINRIEKDEIKISRSTNAKNQLEINKKIVFISDREVLKLREYKKESIDQKKDYEKTQKSYFNF